MIDEEAFATRLRVRVDNGVKTARFLPFVVDAHVGGAFIFRHTRLRSRDLAVRVDAAHASKQLLHAI